MNYNDPELRQQLASEYALGLLRGAPAKRFERLLKDDSDLRQLVSAEQARFAPLLELFPAEPPAEKVWKKIETQLFQQTALTDAKIEKDISRGHSWASTFYKGWAAVATIALGVMVFQWPTTDPHPEQLVSGSQGEVSEVIESESIEAEKPALIAVLSAAATKEAAWLINIDLTEKELTAATLAPQPIATDRVFELWVKLADRPTVDSLGLISADGMITLDLSDELADAIATSEFLGVSVEPLGGSPTGQPTTTPSYAGTIVQI